MKRTPHREKEMKINKLHSWDITPKDAVEIQKQLAGRIVERLPHDFCPRLVAAADISCNRLSSRLFAAVVVLTLPDLEQIEVKTASVETGFPYVPGLLSFRELPVLEAAFEALENEPDFVIMDGHGRAHPRRLGLACHAGLILDCPVVGSAKSLLIGKYDEPGVERGSFSPVIHKGETIGEVVRTRANVKPVFVSTGNHIDLPAARRLILDCAPRFRIPAPVRAAHNAANDARRSFYSGCV